ncbi:MAG: hypothetical protein QOI87_702 [Bradyrhizobium sp.]|nr:hypothetical protein [Bradyrhizobium sp.]
MTRLPNSILCAAVLLLSAEDPGSHASAMRPQSIRTTELTTDRIAVNDLTVLMSQGEVRCPALERSSEPTDPATTSGLRVRQFVASEHFIQTSSSNAEIKISWLGATFKQRFLSKVEDDEGDAILRTFVLRRPSPDAEIIAELGIHDETKLGDLWCLLSLQPNGESGTLLTNAVPNVFYIRDIDGNLGAVDAVWGGAGWEIGASSLDAPTQWLTGRRMISR